MRNLWILRPVFISLLFSLLLSKLYDKKEKRDKGYSFCYWGLSYRRKLIRTLWMIPVGIIVMYFFYITFQSYLLTCVVGTVLGIVLLIQVIYNYKKWKAEEQ